MGLPLRMTVRGISLAVFLAVTALGIPAQARAPLDISIPRPTGANAVGTRAIELGMATPAAAVDPPALEKAYTEHLGQLITAPGRGGVNELNNRANGTVGMRGTDLGVSFESQGRLYFLFGDSLVMGGGTLISTTRSP